MNSRSLRLTMLAGIAAVAVLFLVTATHTQPQVGESAWHELLREQPEAVDDTSISPLERRILSRLTPEQARAWASGASPGEIILADGKSLDALIGSLKNGSDEQLVFTPLPGCTMVRTADAVGPFAEDEARSYLLRGSGRDYSSLGGSPSGCGIPGFETLPGGNRTNGARAVVINLKASDPTGEGKLRVWPSNYPQPASDFLFYDAGTGRSESTMAIVPMCDEQHPTSPCASGDITVKTVPLSGPSGGDSVDVTIDVLGYFRTLDLPEEPPPPPPGSSGNTLSDPFQVTINAISAPAVRTVSMVPSDNSFCFLTRMIAAGDVADFDCNVRKDDDVWRLRARVSTTYTVHCEARCVEW